MSLQVLLYRLSSGMSEYSAMCKGPNHIQWYLGIRPLWNKSNLVYALFGREKFCLVYDLCLEYDSRARTCMSQNES
jgi:hypothetical protein